jgi:hypothetical protein
MTTTTTTFKNGPLKTLISARVRLSDDERRDLKASYRSKREQQLPTSEPVMRGSSISVATAFGGKTELDKTLGLDSFLMSDVLNSRDSLSLPAVLQLQQTLEVPVICKKEFLESCEHYWDYLTESVRT